MKANIQSLAARLLRTEEGATLVEYVLLIALIGVAVAIAMSFLSSKAQNTFNNAGNNLL
jgi:Flp pilus assembly pilin Flp